jgi:hypothetical protein
MYVLQYRAKNAVPTVASSAQSHHPTEEAARQAAAAFLRVNGLTYDVFIARPFVKVSLKEDPIVVEEIRY